MNANPNWASPPSPPPTPPPDVEASQDGQLLVPTLPVELPQSPVTEPQPPPPAYEAAALVVAAAPAAPLAAAAVAPAAAARKTPPAATLALADHKVRISEAIKLPNDADDQRRDVALIAALRGVSAELEAAEEDHARAAKRLDTARELFDWATGALSGYAKTKEPKSEELLKRGRKRKGEESNGNDSLEVVYEEKFMPPKVGLLIPPLAATSGGGMTEEQVVAHRDAFYRKLCGLPFAELGSFTPPAHLVNLKSREKLDEYIFIVTHWDTGVEGIDMMDFRRKHKTFYTKMKLSKENIGRRMGHHLRNLAGNEGKKAFCRYGRRDESLMYISVEELYDAIFEVHCLTGHRAWLASKKIANLKYANLPQDQIKCFIDTCPICSSRKLGPKRQKTRVEAEKAV